jgi:hypothetical protein
MASTSAASSSKSKGKAPETAESVDPPTDVPKNKRHRKEKRE